MAAMTVSATVGWRWPPHPPGPRPPPDRRWLVRVDRDLGINRPDPARGSQLNDVAINTAGQAIAAWDQFSYSGSGSATIGTRTMASAFSG